MQESMLAFLILTFHFLFSVQYVVFLLYLTIAVVQNIIQFKEIHNFLYG